MANEHFTFSEKIRSGSWSTAAWHALIRFLNDRFTAVETGFDGMPTEAEIATLTDIAAVTPADGTFLVGDGTDFVGESGSTVRTSAGLGASDNVTFATVTGTTSGTFGRVSMSGSTVTVGTGLVSSGQLDVIGIGGGTLFSAGTFGIELGHASDTTLARSSAGNVTVEGNLIYRAGGTDVPVTDGGTGRSTSTTAYGLIAAGTTATGAHQTLSAGATTAVLVGGGSSALPVWTTATGSGAPVRATSPTLVTPTLGAASATSLTTTGNIELGHASDTTLARSAAGRATIEGKTIVLEEEGTWTPVLSDASTGGNVASFNNLNASYRRFHTTSRSLIHLQFRCSAIDTTGMTGGNDLFIQGLPFAVYSASDHQGPVGLYRITYTGFVNVQPARTTTYARLEESVSGAILDYVTVGELVSGSAAMSFNVWYEATT